LQGTREVEGLVFQMTSDLGKLKRKIDVLGTAKDTMQHRCASLAGNLKLQASSSGKSWMTAATTAIVRNCCYKLQ
jgi:hypothetical protein